MKAWPLAAIVLLGCTGQNVDENFVSTHGAVLARVECDSGIKTAQSYGLFNYKAVMFLDGSVMAQASAWSQIGTLEFYERSDASRTHARVNVGQYQNLCSGAGEYFEINSGKLGDVACTNLGTYVSQHDWTLSTDCTGFNKTLFN